ncbi:MAG: 1-(5-phosphoribosyl)-5-[(5-phosphoribosylamino)methylideneamino]imidazole-4-carboxamide isomerase [Gammaproteobacteria bacterium]|nr:1-(5-phosphoribosyl)-5-[(5-phosphoribosylamino)methylideneamino]imidazole-4-carboxamide isomerase [Gammaproteobacteria bacterium]MCS5544014.1 1-(5-phosphoribosyl)-5-[(5-phosphoribosylamino)methylideneamino]imidazole-4-carboxamide isomerase [SAR86 cluster bacterium]|tara:strand:+ start:60 stop:791 length:732 start_codon:yes stop_codon:yes gene_type:complete
MLIIPAIDIKGGKCVRLRRGQMSTAKVFSDSPLEIVKSWVSQGAQLIHVIDLDGAKNGLPINDNIIKKIVRSFNEIDFQVGGGIRNIQSAASYLEAGVSKIILGTQAIKEPSLIKKLCSLYPGRIVLAVDFYKGKIKKSGWAEGTNLTPEEVISLFSSLPLAAIVITDISRDGMMNGPNISVTLELASLSSIPVIVSGGIANLDHIKKIISANSENRISGVICGRSLYEKSFSLEEAIKVTKF